MRPQFISPATAGSTPLALRGKASLRTVFATAVAAAIGFVPAIMIASPAAAAAGDISISDVTAAEGQSLSFTVTRLAGVGVDEAYNYSVTPGTASTPSDYTAPGGVVTFLAADQGTDQTRTIIIPTSDDLVDEVDAEDFVLNLTRPVGAIGVNNDLTAVGTITDNDATPMINLTGGGPAVEGGNATFGLTLDRASDRPITVRWDSVATPPVAGRGAATPSLDFDYPVSAGRTITINAGQTVGSITIPVSDDALDELDEAFDVTLAAPTNAVLGSSTRLSALITDDVADLPPAVVVTPTAVDEGNAGSSTKTFTANLVSASGRPVTVNWATAPDGTVGVGKAVAGQDYTAANGTLTFPAGTLSQTFTVPILGDLVDEDNGETFLISLSNVDSSATLTDPNTVITITDDDNVPTFSVADIVYKELNDVSVILVPIKLSAASDRATTFTITNTPTTGDTAEEGLTSAPGSNDFDLPGSPVTIAAGQTTGYAFIPVNGDDVFEGNETTHFTVTSTTAYAAGAAKTPMLTLTNDDLAPDLEITSVTGAEGDTVALKGVVTRVAQGATLLNVNLDGASVDGSDAAEAGDFTDPGPIGVTIPGGTASGSVVDVAGVVLTDDLTAEGPETILASGVGFGGTGSVTDGVITISASDGGVDPDPTPTPTDPTPEPTDPVEPGTPTLSAPPYSIGVGGISLYGTAMAGAEVELWGAAVGDEDLVLLDSTEADDESNYSFTVTLDSTGFRFQTKSGGLTSDVATVWLKHRPTLTLTQNGNAVTIRVIGNPKFEGLVSIIQQYVNGAWKNVAIGSHGSNGIYTRTMYNLKRGTGYTYRAYTLGNEEVGQQGGYAPYKRIILH